MATESFLVTALPYSAAPGETFHVSLFITHRLTPDSTEGVLDDFGVVREWTARLRSARITLRGGAPAGGAFDIPATPLLDVLDTALWPRVFPGTLAVRPWQVPNHAAAPWRTFPAHRMQQHALLVHAASIFSSPVAAPGVMGNVLTRPLLQAMGFPLRGEVRLEQVIDGAHDRQISALLDELTARAGVRGDASLAFGELPLLQLVADVHRARRFYQRDEDETAYRDRPLTGAKGLPISKPLPDFHARASLIGDLSPLMRKLGLVIDLRVDDVSRLAGAAWIQGDVTFEGAANAQQGQPRTACRVVGQTFTAVSTSGDYELGMLRLGDEERFTVLDVDPDASALKLEQLVRNIPRLAAAESNGDAVSSAPSTLRATGFAIARINRAQQLHERVNNAAEKDAAVRAGTGPLVSLEQVNRGHRLEVWDDASGKWHSLHQRLLSVDVSGTGPVLAGESDVGFLQGASLTRSDTASNGPMYAHEVLAGWDGWSLSAPRPGKVVVHEDGKEKLVDAPDADPDPVNPVVSRSEVAPGSLPWLRYGRSYALRAYAVDLAGNSRPHLLGGAGAATPPGGGVPNPPGGGVPEGPGGRPGERPAPGRPGAGRPPLERPVPGRADAGRIAVEIENATTEMASRRAAMSMDATLPPARSDARAVRGNPAHELLRESIQSLRTSRVEEPQAAQGARGIDPANVSGLAGIADAALPGLDRLVASRLEARARGTASTGPTRVRQIEQTFGELAGRVPYLMERTDLHVSPQQAGSALASMIAQQPGLPAVGSAGSSASDLLAISSTLITSPRPFLRWDPVIEPATVPRHAFTEGESLLRLVIRSGVKQSAPGELSVTVTPPAAYAAQVLADHPDLGLVWRADSQRHLAPPKSSQLDAEMHGAFDQAFGASTPAAAVRSALGIALRESGSFLDVTVADLANPGQRLAQPGVTFHVTPTADAPDVATPEDLPDGDALSPGQYVAHDVDEVVLPYLPDPLAAGVAFTFPDAGRDHRLAGLLAIEGTTLRYQGTWPGRTPFRMVLESGAQLGAVVEGHVVRITLPPGEQLRMRMSSSLARESLELLGLWRSLPQVVRDNPVLREAAADGWFWWLTPSTELRLVHAVPRPVEVPRLTMFAPIRMPNDTAVILAGAVDVHGPSTERLDIEASWTQWVDDVTKPGPERISGIAAACGTSITADEDLVVLGGADATIPLPDNNTLRIHAAVHQTGDTQHRLIEYRVRATTRYREYFLPQVAPDIDALSVVGPARTLDVPSSARPPKLVVRDVLPLFRWSEETEPSQPFGMRRTRRAGVRIYFERPWYVTGDGELVGVVLATGSDALVRGSVSQWGGDPVFRQQGPAQRQSLPLTDLLHFIGLDDRQEAGRPAAPPVALPLVDIRERPTAWVLGYQPEYSEQRGLWFVDIAMDPGTAFWPFVQFAVARYQPSSLPGLHLGPVTMCDYVQLAPERMATVSRTDEAHARVVVTGAVGHPALMERAMILDPGFLAQVAATRTMRARLERFDPAVGTDLAWVTISQQDLPILGVDGAVVSWAGEVALPEEVAPRTPGSSTEWRVTLEEWEWLQADIGAGGRGGLEPRIIYADHLPL